MRALVFAYQSVGHACLDALLDLGADPVSVVTHRDSPGEQQWFPSVERLARRFGLETCFGEDFGPGELLEHTRAFAPDVIFSFYYRRMLPMAVLDVAPLGGFNMHGSLLPRFRGRCPINWVIIEQERFTGVTLHAMVQKPDAGDIAGQRVIEISDRETAASLYDKVVPKAVEILREAYPRLVDGSLLLRPQIEALASYYGGRTPEDGRIDWSQSCDRIDALVRAVTHPFPGAFTHCGSRQLFIWEATPTPTHDQEPPGSVLSHPDGSVLVACGSGALQLRSVSWRDGKEIREPALAETLGLGQGTRLCTYGTVQAS